MKREDATLLLDQSKYLLEDERAFGDKLINDRKIKLSLVAILVGFGFFNLDSATDIAMKAGESGLFWIGVISIVVVSVLLIVALYFLVLENDPKFTRKLIGDIKSDLANNRTDSSDEVASSDLNPKKIFGAALVVLYPDEEVVASVESDGYPEIANRIADYQTAYIRLANANRRVRRRLEYGTMSLIFAFIYVIILSGIVIGMSLHSDTQVDAGIVLPKEGVCNG